MSDDLLITPGSRKLEIKDSSGNVDAKIETDASGNLSITNAGGDISIGDTSSDIFVGDGTNNVDIVFEQDGEIRGTSGVTVTLGASGSNVRMASDLNLNGNDITGAGNITLTGNLNITGDINSASVTDLDVTDKTITLGVGQNEASSGGSGIVVAGSNASILWDETNDEWDFNKKANFANTPKVGSATILTDNAGLNANLINSGTLPNARLSNTVPYGANGANGTENSFTTDGGQGANNLTRSTFFRDNGQTFGALGVSVSHPTNSAYTLQIASSSYSTPNIQARVQNNGTWGSPVTLWSSGNDGSGSGLDADKLDNQQGSYYLDRANHTGTLTLGTVGGTPNFTGAVTALSLDSTSGDISLNGERFVRQKSYSGTGNIGTSGSYYTLFYITEHNTPVYLTLKTAAHSTQTFVITTGYHGSNVAHVQMLSSTYTQNGAYPGISGVRILKDSSNNYRFQLQLTYSSGPTGFTLDARAFGATDAADVPSFQSSLTVDSTTGTTIDSLDTGFTGSSRTGQHRAASGSQGTPSYSFNGDSNTGMFRDTADSIGFTSNGTQRVTISNSGLDIKSGTLKMSGTNIINGADLENVHDIDFDGVIRSTNNANADGPNFDVATTNKDNAEYAYRVTRSGSVVAGIKTAGDALFGAVTANVSDGTAILLQRNGSTAAKFGVASGPVGFLVLNDTTSNNVAAIKGTSAAILPSTNSGGDKNGTMDLGSSSVRFRNLFLSGNITCTGTITSGKIEGTTADANGHILKTDSSGASASDVALQLRNSSADYNLKFQPRLPAGNMHTGVNADDFGIFTSNSKGISIGNNDKSLVVIHPTDGIEFHTNNTNRFNITTAGNLQLAGGTVIDANQQGIFPGGVLSSNARVSTSQRHPLGHYTTGEEVFSIDPTWTNAQLQEYFDDSNVEFFADSTAPDGYAIKITGAVSVGGTYTSGFPYIPSGDTGDEFYMECYIRNEDSNQTHYMGSQEFSESFGQATSGYGNPGSFGYWVMSNTNPGTSWTKVSGYLKQTGGSNTTGQFETGAKYFTPQALFNYTAGSGTRVCYISGWKCFKVTRPGGIHVKTTSDSRPAIVAENTGGISGTIQEWIGDSDKMQMINESAGDYFLKNSQQSNGIFFADGTGGVSLRYNNTDILQVNSTGGVNVNSGTLKMGGTQVINQNRDYSGRQGSFTSFVETGTGSGGVALTINDGYGNANVTFNHKNGTPEQNGQAGRIEVNTDATTGAGQMSLEVSGSAVTNGTAVSLTPGLYINPTSIQIPYEMSHVGDTDTLIRFSGANQILHVVGGVHSCFMDTSLMTVNPNGGNYDFRVEGDTDVNNLYSDASTDRIGIGTASPGSKLDVNGNTNITGTLTTSSTIKVDPASGDAIVQMEGAGGAQILRIDQNSIRTSTNSDLSIFTNGNTRQIFLDQSSGNTGFNMGSDIPYIGTAVHIKGDDTSPSLSSTAIDDCTLVLSNSDDDYGTVFGQLGTGTGVIQARRMASAVYYNLALNPHGGSVGIGVEGPGQKLDVRGGNIAVGGYGSGNDYGAIFTPADSSTYWHIYNDTGGELAFGRNITIGSDEKARFDSSGRFGIATNNPTHKLHVAGDAKITGPILEGPASANVYSYASHFSASSASIQITFGRETNSTGTGAIGADADNCFAVWNTASTARRFEVRHGGDAHFVGDLYMPERLRHVGDTNTYIQFHAADQFRVVTGGAERLEVRSTGVSLGTSSNRIPLAFANVSAMSSTSDTITIGDVDENDDYSTVQLITMAGNGRLVVGDGEIFMYGTQNSNAEFKFTSNGILHADNDVIAFSSTIGSDRKLKENIKPLENSLDKVLSLDGISFDWKDKSKGSSLGFIAQDVEKVLPVLVKEVETLKTENETHKVVNYDGVVPVLVEAMKEQQKLINRLEERIKDLENKKEE